MRVTSAILRQSGLPTPYAQSHPLSIETIELAPPGPDEVLIKIMAAGVCHSDLSGINGNRPRPLPVALGHEASATVEEVGANVTGLKRGDHVVMSFLPVCGVCSSCSVGRASLCEPGHAANARGTLLSGQRRFSCDGLPLNHHSGVSAFSEYSVVSKYSVVKITDAISLTHAALFGCAVMTGVGMIVNTCSVRPGQSVAIVGLGGVGLSALLGAVAACASRIVAIDMLPEKLKLAKSLGATDTFLASAPNVAEEIRAATGGGTDYAVEMAGVPRAFELAFAITRRGGLTASAGLARPDALFQVPPVALVTEERSIRGSYMGSCVPSRDIPRFIDLFLSGKLPVDKLLSSTGPLSEINEAFDKLDRGEIIRHVIEMNR
jgi:alcohol dehydrogenase